jgi:hypothetical protein
MGESGNGGVSEVRRWDGREWGLNKRSRDGSVSCVKTMAPVLACDVPTSPILGLDQSRMCTR